MVDFNAVTETELSIYCKRDVEILKRWILLYREFVSANDLGNFKSTLAAQAFAAFRHRFMPEKIYIHDNKAVYAIERKSYKGGRNECFFIGKRSGETFYLLDVNSMYPHVLATTALPTKLVGYERAASVRRLASLIGRYAVVADATIEVTQPCVGLKAEKLVFPVGTFRTALTTPELEYVLKSERVVKVHEMAWYESSPFAKDYIAAFYSKKAEAKASGDNVGYMLSKLFMNALYGKFGQRSEKYEIVGDCPNDDNEIEEVVDCETNEAHTNVKLMGKIWRCTEKGESFDSFPAIAAHVTGAARMYLWELIRKASRSNVLYCDTDSLLVSARGKDNLRNYIDGETLGKLSVQLETDDIEIRGCKDYRLGDKTVIKGVRKNAIQTGPAKFTQDRFLKFRSLLRAGIDNRAAVAKVTKTLKRKYDKGRVLTSGDVMPYRLTPRPDAS